MTAVISNPAGTQTGAIVDCDAGPHVTGGGVTTTGFFGANQEVNMSGPDGNHGWIAFVDNRGGADESFRVYVICTDATSTTGALAEPALVK